MHTCVTYVQNECMWNWPSLWATQTDSSTDGRGRSISPLGTWLVHLLVQVCVGSGPVRNCGTESRAALQGETPGYVGAQGKVTQAAEDA